MCYYGENIKCKNGVFRGWLARCSQSLLDHRNYAELKNLCQVGRNLNSDRQASEVLYEMHNISENAQLIQGENPMLMTWIIFRSAGSSKLRVTDNRFWVREKRRQSFLCVQYRAGLIAIDHLDALWKIIAIINRKHWMLKRKWHYNY